MNAWRYVRIHTCYKYVCDVVVSGYGDGSGDDGSSCDGIHLMNVDL